MLKKQTQTRTTLGFLSLLVALPILAQSAAAADGAAAAQPNAAASQASASPAPGADPLYTYKTLRLNRAAFDALAAKPEDLLVLDVRRPDEVEKAGGFPVYLSIQTSDVQKHLAFIPRDRLIVVVSNRAHRAGAIGDILTGLGYRVVGAIGVKDYEDEGGHLTKISAPSPGATASTAAPAPAGQASATR